MARISVALCIALVALVAHGHIINSVNTDFEFMEDMNKCMDKCMDKLNDVAGSILKKHNEVYRISVEPTRDEKSSVSGGCQDDGKNSLTELFCNRPNRVEKCQLGRFQEISNLVTPTYNQILQALSMYEEMNQKKSSLKADSAKEAVEACERAMKMASKTVESFENMLDDIPSRI